MTSPFVGTAEQLFGELAARYSRYSSKIELTPDHPASSIELTFPEQPGLPFAVYAHLQVDELQLGIDDSVAGEWWLQVPGSMTRFQEAINCILDGTGRVVQFSRWGKVLKSKIQRPSERGWQTFYTSRYDLYVPFLPFKKRVIQASPYVDSDRQ